MRGKEDKEVGTAGRGGAVLYLGVVGGATGWAAGRFERGRSLSRDIKKKRRKRNTEKVSHNNGIITTYETNTKQTDQTENTRTQERK